MSNSALSTSSQPSPDSQASSIETPDVNLYELFLGVLTLTSFAITIFLILSPFNDDTREVMLIVDILICVIFLMDFFARLFRAPSKRDYLFWQGIADLLGSIPNVPWLRVFRLVRLYRLRRFGGPKYMIAEFAKRRAEGVLYITTILALILIAVGSELVLLFERVNPAANIKSGSDAIWWSLATVTTVGYGDRFPTTMGGRLVAIAMMIFGIGIFGVITSFLSQAFLTSSKKESTAKAEEQARVRSVAISEITLLQNQIAGLQNELSEIKSLLKERRPDEPH